MSLKTILTAGFYFVLRKGEQRKAIDELFFGYDSSSFIGCFNFWKTRLDYLGHDETGEIKQKQKSKGLIL